MDRPWLPNLLRDMAEVHGLDRALAFAAVFGGRYLYLPVRAEAGHEVAKSFGLPMLEWLLERPYHAPGTRIVVPKGPSRDKRQREAALRTLLARPLTNNQVAAETGMHVRDVQRWRARFEAEATRRQMDLFRRGDAA
jgi:hypothetical protein